MSKQFLVRLPDQVVADLERMVPAGKRTAFITRVVEEKLAQETLLEALEGNFGLFSAEEYPEFASTEDIASWVGHLRASDRRRTGPERGPT